MKAIFCSLAICLLTLLPTTAQEKSVRPGINKPFEKPDIEEFLKKFEGESREIAAHRKEIVAACKIKPGMTVADVGAGTGLFTRMFATEVGDKGKVFAVDISSSFLRHIEKTCEADKIKNVETVLCDQFSTKLPKNSVDLVFICDTYHHFEFPQRTLQSIHDALRPGGQIILIDFERIEGKSTEFIMGHVRAGKEVFVREVKAGGFKVVGEEKLLKENYFVRFEKVSEKGPGRSDDTGKGTCNLRGAGSEAKFGWDFQGLIPFGLHTMSSEKREVRRNSLEMMPDKSRKPGLDKGAYDTPPFKSDAARASESKNRTSLRGLRDFLGHVYRAKWQKWW